MLSLSSNSTVNQARELVNNFCYRETNSIRLSACYELATTVVQSVTITDTRSTFSSTDIYISEAFYLVGQKAFYSTHNNSPDLSVALGNFIIAAFLSNSKAQSKLYFLMETGIIDEILKQSEYKNLLESNENLKTVYLTDFYQNFTYTREEERKQAALIFLYLSALAKDVSAMTTLAYKLFKGYGVLESCEGALKYYKEVSTIINQRLLDRHRPNTLSKFNIAGLEYIGQKQDNYYSHNEMISYLRQEANNGSLKAIKELGQRYFFANGVEQDFELALNFFNQGIYLYDDASCHYYKGRILLHGFLEDPVII